MPLLAAYAVPHPPLLIPEIGRGEEKEIQNTYDSMETISRQIQLQKPDTIIVISPHAQFFDDRFAISAIQSLYGDMLRFNVSHVSIQKNIDRLLTDQIYACSMHKSIPVHRNRDRSQFIDHGALVPLYFIEKYYSDYDLIVISLSDLSYEEHFIFGQCIANSCAASDRKVVLIASGDLSHRLTADGPYGFAKEGPLFDQTVVALMASSRTDELKNMDPLVSIPAAECGLRSLIIMAGALKETNFTSHPLSYEGPFGVGYAVCAFLPPGESLPIDSSCTHATTPENPLVALAQKSLTEYIVNAQTIPLPSDLPEALTTERAGVFVTLKKNGQLRGCIGTIEPTTNSIAAEIIRNAIESGTSDPRFSPVQQSELPQLEYSVDVLTKATRVLDKNELDPARFGIIVSYRGRKGLLLPNLEGVDSIDEQLSIALSKAAIPPSADYLIEKFEVIRHK